MSLFNQVVSHKLLLLNRIVNKDNYSINDTREFINDIVFEAYVKLIRGDEEIKNILYGDDQYGNWIHNPSCFILNDILNQFLDELDEIDDSEKNRFYDLYNYPQNVQFINSIEHAQNELLNQFGMDYSSPGTLGGLGQGYTNPSFFG